MNILYHHRTQSKGVEGVHISEVVNALKRLGNNVDVVSPSGLNQHKAKDSQKVNKLYQFISRFLPEICFEVLEILYNITAIKKISTLLDKKHYDLIYERYAIFNYSGIKIAKKYKIPIILEVNYTSFAPLYRKRSDILKPLAHWLDKRIFKEASGIIVVSNYLKEHLIGLGIDKDKITVSTNAADPTRFNPDISGKEIRKKYNLSSKKVIGFVGGFYPWHGLDLLIDCFKDIKRDIEDAVLLLIGDGPMKDKLIDKVRSLGLDKDILFINKISHENLPEYIASFDIAVMPDSNDYGSPMKIYEYMAMAKPVVAPRLGPLEDGIDDGIEGLLFKQRDREELTPALKSLLLDEAMRKKMGCHGREKILREHTWQRNAESILSHFTSRKARKKILFITPRLPYPPIKGDMLRPYHFIKELSKNHAIDLCTFYQNEDELKNIEEMQKYCKSIETVLLTKTRSYINMFRTFINFRPFQVNYYYSKEMAKRVRAMSEANRYDIVHIVLQRMMPYAKYCNGEKLVLDQIDALSLNMARRAKTEVNIFKRAAFYYEWLNIKRQEERTKQRYDACIVTSDIDKDALNDESIKVIPNGVDMDYFTPERLKKDIDLIFTGNMGYFPNVDAACYLCKEILPKVLKAHPRAKLYIVGARPNSKVKALADNKNVFVTGFVDDMRPYLNRAKVFVAPLRSGSGIQNKILEAMACGLPVVTSSHGNAGIKADKEKHLIIADNPKDFAGILIDFIDNESDKRFKNMADEAQNLVKKDFSWSSRGRSLEAVYESVC